MYLRRLVKNIFFFFFTIVFLVPFFASAQNPNLPYSPDALFRLNSGWDFKTATENEKKANVKPEGDPVVLRHGGPNPIPFAACSNMGGESGWGVWQTRIGYHKLGGAYPVFFNPPGAPTAPRFMINTPGTDPCTPGGGGPAVPYVCPGFGNASLQLGQKNTSGINGNCANNGAYPAPGTGAAGNGCSEQATYPLTVTAQDTNFIYAFAIFLENPNGGHTATETPFAEIYMLDQNGDTVKCSHRKYVSDPNGGVGPGFFQAQCVGSLNAGFPSNGMDVTYMPWTLVGINLSQYIGQTLTVVITNSDCALGGHYCYSYWDFSCGVFTTNPATYCVGQSVTISAPTHPLINYNYLWAPGGQTSQTIVVKPNPGDTFRVHLHQPSGCDFWVTYVPQPLGAFANFNFTPNCSGSVVFTDSSGSPNGTPITGWNWQFPGGTPSSSTSQNPTVTYPAGTYTATLIVTSQGGCTDTMVKPLTITGVPKALFTVGPVCVGNTTQFTNGSTSSTGDPIVSWSWSFPGGTPSTSTAQNPTVTYPAGSYSATLTVTTAGGCTATVTQPVTVNPLPVANMSAPNVCLGTATAFTDLSTGNNTISSWAWNFGDGGTSASQNPSHTYAAAGTYSVTLLVTNNFGCTSTNTITVTVNPIPVPNFSPTTVCVGGQTCFTDASTISTGSITSWSWSFGDPASGANDTSSAQSPCHTFSSSGNFSVSLTVTSSNGCKATIVLPATVNPLPVVQFTSAPVCDGNPTAFTGTSTINPVTWQWSFPGGTPATSTSQNPTVTYPAGSYSATATVTAAGGCTATVTQPVTVNPLPVANMKGPNVCFNNVTSFTDLSTGNTTVSSWAWNFGDGKTSTSQNPTHTYTNPGTYAVTLTVTNTYGCVSSNTITVVVNPLPIANFSSPVVCLHDSTCFTNLSSVSPGTVTGWSWNFGDAASGTNNISNLQNPCHTFTGLGPFTVILTVTSDSGCQSTTMLPATTNPPPVASFTSVPVCLGLPTVFTDLSTPAPGTIVGWDWDFGDGTTPHSTAQHPTHTYSPAGTYTATLIVTSAQGCKDTVDKPVTVYNLPVAGFTSPDSGCSPVCKTFTDTSIAGSGAITSWQWTFPSGGNPSFSTSQNGSSCWTAPGSYGVGLIVTNTYGCTETIFRPNYITVFDWPKADFCVSPDKAPTTDPVFTFCPLWSPDVTSWVWNFGDGTPLDSSKTNPVHSYSAAATNNDFYGYNICLSVKNVHGCWDSICKPVELLPYFTFYIPNCVTPNGDFNNEFFFGKCRGVKDYNIWVFDRWGNLLWDCHHNGKNTDWDMPGQDGMAAACKWDAKVVPGGMDMSGQTREIQQEDVYVWKVQLTDIFDKIHNYIGHVSIVK